MPKEYSPTWSASAISSSRCSIRSAGPMTRSVAGSVTAETKLSTPTCMRSSGRSPGADGLDPFNAQPGVNQTAAGPVRRSRPVRETPAVTETAVRWAGTNWAGNYRYGATTLHRPESLAELQEIVAGAPQLHALGSRHSFTAVADAAELVTLEAMTSTDVAIAADRRTVTVDAGLRYGELVEVLNTAGLALHNLASLPPISRAGAVAPATHGSGVGNRNLAAAVSALELVTSTGELVRSARGDADF